MNTLFVGENYLVRSSKYDDCLEIVIRDSNYNVISTTYLDLNTNIISFCLKLINAFDYQSPKIINVISDKHHYEFEEFYPAVHVKKVDLHTKEILFSRHFITELSYNFINDMLNENELHSS